MKPWVIRFDPAGDGHCLYTETVNLAAIGPLQIARASNIEFNQEKQVWEVRNASGGVLFSHRFRTLCLDWEQHHFNQ